jgi:predicted nucleotidyltransferase
MRLSDDEIKTIKKLALDHFGPGVKVYLFGSRTDDRKKGGDIDLFITHSNKEQLNSRKKLGFLTDLILKIGEQKIDVVLDKKDTLNPGFLETIKKTRIEL